MKIRIKKEWILFIIGLSILTFGGRTLLLANIGVGGIDAIVVGLSKMFGGSIGLWIDIVSYERNYRVDRCFFHLP